MSRLWWHRTRRLSLIAVGVLLTLAATGIVYQSLSVRREAGRFPPPGRLVDIGGRRLHLLCIGEGSPVVIFEPSGFGNALSSSKARAEIGTRTRVCSYDRMGTGWSDPGPEIIPAGVLAGDLERLLDRAAIPPPYILVPSSIGGLTSEVFARRHAERVAGLVFLDAATSGLVDRLLPELTWTRTQAVCLTTLAARVGLLRLIDPFDLRRNGTDAEARAVALMYRVEPMATLCGIVRGAPTTAEEFRAAPPLASDVPLTVLSAESNEQLLPAGWGAGEWILTRKERHALHEAMSRRSSRGQWRIVPGSSHLIGSSQPQAVAGAVIEMIERIRGRAAGPAGSS